MKGSKYHNEIKPSKASLYFKPELLESLVKDIKEQILTGKAKNLKNGKGVFLFEDVATDQGQMEIAVFALWSSSPDKSTLENFQTIEYHLYQGALPDSVSAKIGKPGPQAKWQTVSMTGHGEQNQVKELKNKVSRLIEFLRSEIISPNEYNIALYLLTLYRNRINLRIIERGDRSRMEIELPSEIVSKRNGSAPGSFLDQLPLIHDVFKPSLEKLSLRGLTEVEQLWNSIDHSLLDKYFPSIFDDLLYKISSYLGKAGANDIQPLELSRFICSLHDLPKDAKVYNPFAGQASFGVFLNGSCDYFGQEFNQATWAVGSLRLMAHNVDRNSRFQLVDSIDQWNPTSKKYDLIVASPPLGLKLPTPFNGKFGYITTYTQFIIENGLADLSHTGKLILLTPLRFLFYHGVDETLRTHLVETDLLEMVVTFPGGLLLSTSIPIAVIIINKNKREKGVVRFVDATNAVATTSAREKKLNDYVLNGIVRQTVDSDSLRIVQNDRIKELDFNLSPLRYFQKEVEGVQLEALVERVRGERPSTLERVGKFVRTRDLNDDRLNHELDYDSIESAEIPRPALKISESVLLLATRWKSLKPTYFKFKGDPIYLLPDTIALKVDEKKIDIDYLIIELHGEYVEDQLNLLRVGGTIPMIRIQDLLSVKIQVLPIEEQRAKVLGVKETYFQVREKELRLEKELLGLKDDSFREFASIKHSMRQYLNALRSNVGGTRKFLLANEDKPISLNSIYSKNLNRTLGEHLLSLEGTIDSMARLLKTGDEINRSNNHTERNSLQTLICEAQNRFKNNELFEFEPLFIDRESFEVGEVFIEPLVQILADDFYRLFSNIVSNAIDHGFKNSKKQNVIRTSLSFNPSQLMCIMEVSNNGSAIPSPFTFKHLVTRGEKTTDSMGSGMGGADIKSIVDKYKGSFILKTDKESDFPVTYVIGFPSLLNISDDAS